MLNKNSTLAGILAALVFPAIAWLTEYVFKTNIFLTSRPAVPYFVAIALNLVMLRFSLKYGWEHTGKGIILATFVFMLLLFIFKIHPIR